ncbi:MAG: rhodanese-like domain-containing protein [Anaerolineales bacterium]|nr:MAG: rhodanese-like domain-containing protein [Anaerolineales bacterium]
MTKKSRSSQSSKRTFIITFTVLALIIGGAAWISTASSASTTAPVIVSQRITPLEYQNEFGDGTPHLLIDVRTPQEFTSGHIQNAINISVETLQARLDEVPGGSPVVVYCRSGNRSASAAQILTENGYQQVYDLGGIRDWVAQGLPIQ